MSETSHEITDINVVLNTGNSDVVADVSFCWCGMHIGNVKIIEGTDGLFLYYPNKKRKSEKIFSCRPSAEAAAIINKAVFEALAERKAAFERKLARLEAAL